MRRDRHIHIPVSTLPAAQSPKLAECLSTGDDHEPLTEAEEAVWSDPERLARIEAVLDDPSLAVPLEELE